MGNQWKWYFWAAATVGRPWPTDCDRCHGMKHNGWRFVYFLRPSSDVSLGASPMSSALLGATFMPPNGYHGRCPRAGHRPWQMAQFTYNQPKISQNLVKIGHIDQKYSPYWSNWTNLHTYSSKKQSSHSLMAIRNSPKIHWQNQVIRTALANKRPNRISPIITARPKKPTDTVRKKKKTP